MQNSNRRLPPPPESIETLRSQIDAIDNSMLELIEQRLSASLAIAALKQGEDRQCLKMRPRREQAVVARLVGRAGNAPPEMVAQIWRTLMSYSLQAQARTELLLCSTENRAALLREVRARFGDAAPVRWAADAGEAIHAAQSREVVAIIAPRLVDPDRLPGTLRTFDRLRGGDGGVLALAIGRIAEEELPAQQLLGSTAQCISGESGR